MHPSTKRPSISPIPAIQFTAVSLSVCRPPDSRKNRFHRKGRTHSSQFQIPIVRLSPGPEPPVPIGVVHMVTIRPSGPGIESRWQVETFAQLCKHIKIVANGQFVGAQSRASIWRDSGRHCFEKRADFLIGAENDCGQPCRYTERPVPGRFIEVDLLT